MSTSTERISEIEREASAAIAATPDSEALEQVRIRYLGRKAELPNLLRGVAQLPPDQRAAIGKAANQARQALERAIEQRGGELAAGELDARLVQDRLDVTLPADPLPAIGRLHLMTRTRREIEDVFIGLGFNVAEGPVAAGDRPLLHQADAGHLRPAGPAAARAHVADAGSGDGGPAAADLHH